MRNLIVCLFTMMVAACGSSPTSRLLQQHHTDLIIVQDFGICKGYGCRYYLKTGLDPEEWQRIVAIFSQAPKNAVEERVAIKKAIALFEQMIGPKTGTDKDAAGAQIINLSTRGQMDCIDEAFNSSTYLYLLRTAGLIRFHRLGQPLRRGNYLNRWPHNTATLHEIDPEANVERGHYVVDSWFHANGEAPEIVPATQWSQGWSPQKKNN